MKIELREYVNSAPLYSFIGVADPDNMTRIIEIMKEMAFEKGIGRFTISIEFTKNNMS